VLVGETGILAAAGRQLAACHDFRWLEHEGAGLKTADPAGLAPVEAGRAPWPAGPGLGFRMDEARLASLVYDPRLVEA
jgi:L-alanine-DL-glutamate epimerase-like enolase superfamily enzyme